MGQMDLQILLLLFYWQGRKPRIKYATLQLAKESGGMSHSCLRNYYYAAQIAPVLYRCNDTYTAKWKELESSLSNQFPIQAVIADRGLMCSLEKMGNPWLAHTLQVWQKVINICEIHRMLRMFSWFAYDSDFIPNRHDSRFKAWTMNGLTTFLSLTQRNTVHSFEVLQDKHGLERNDFHRYLQSRSYIEHECKLSDFSDVESEFYHILKHAMTTTLSNSISKLYTALSHANNTVFLHWFGSFLETEITFSKL